MQELIAVMMITVFAVISPGGDFAMVTRNSYLYGLQAGILTTLGIATAVWLHVAYTLLGMSILLIQFPTLFHLIKTFGAIYLIYIGYRTFCYHTTNIKESQEDFELTRWTAFKNGFLSNALNPKTTLFVLSTFTQIVQPHTPITIQIGYGAFISFAHLFWFAFVAKVLSTPAIRNRLLNQQKLVNRLIGFILGLLGILLLFSAIQ